MKETKTNERGSVMMEIIAVLALLGIMGPLLLKQVANRNEELDNVNMASEMRTIKEAFASYIAADTAKLNEVCQLNSNGAVSECAHFTSNYSTYMDNICYFLPDGFCGETDGGTLDYYTLRLYGYIQDPDISPKPVFYGLIIPRDEILPSNMNLKRASRVASMVGTDGGIYDSGQLIGTMGSWVLDAPSGFASVQPSAPNFYVAMTGLDIYVPDVEVQEIAPNAVALPENLALGKLHAWNYFSVGNTTADNARCFELYHDQLTTTGNATASNDEIKSVGTDGCDPLFWVGATGRTGSDRSEPNQVYVKNNLYIGRQNSATAYDGSTGISAVAIETDDNTLTYPGDDDTTTEGRNKQRRIVVYDIAGREKVTIDARGQIAVKGDDIEVLQSDGTTVTEPETLTIADGKIESNRTVLKDQRKSASSKEVQNYVLDPAYTSVLNDIKLTSRGGARLSEILPNYIAKGVYVLNRPSGTSTTASSFTTSIEKPLCPSGYAPAIIVTPTRWDSGRVNEIDISHTHTLNQEQINSLINKTRVNIPANLTSTYVQTPYATSGATANIGNNTRNNMVIGDNKNNTTGVFGGNDDRVKQEEARFAVLIDNNETDFVDNDSDLAKPRSAAHTPTTSSTGSWSVKMGYKSKNDTDLSSFTGKQIGDSISALAQTYCVFDSTLFEDAPDKDRE